MIRRPPRSTRTDTSFPTRRSSDLSVSVADSLSEGSQRVQRIIEDKLAIVRLRQIAMVRVPWLIPLKESDMMPSRRQSADQGPPGRGMPITPGRGEAEIGRAHV